MNKFKIGDKVIYIRNNTNDRILKFGNEYEIMTYHESTGNCLLQGHFLFYSSNDFILKKQYEFKKQLKEILGET